MGLNDKRYFGDIILLQLMYPPHGSLYQVQQPLLESDAHLELRLAEKDSKNNSHVVFEKAHELASNFDTQTVAYHRSEAIQTLSQRTDTH